ncbi:MAG: adenylate/guanylate cyclase domain-containing protein [Bacteroidota bacterium]
MSQTNGQETLLQEEIDGLKAQLAENPVDSDKVRMYYTLGRTFSYMGGAYDSAMHYCQLAYDLAVEMESPIFQARALYYLGEQNVEVYDEKALTYFKKAEEIGGNLGNKPLLGAIASGRAGSYMNMGNYDEARTNFIKTLELAEEAGGPYYNMALAIAYNNIGRTYNYQGKFDKAIEQFFKAKENYEIAEDIEGLADLYLNISGSYFKSKNIDNGFEWLEKALDLYLEIGNQPNTFYCYSTYASQYTEQRAYDAAKPYVDSCFSLAKVLDTDGRNFYKGLSHHEYGKLLKAQGENDQAIQEFNDALNIYTKNNEVGERRELIGQLAEVLVAKAEENTTGLRSSEMANLSDMEEIILQNLQDSELSGDYEGIVSNSNALIGIYKVGGDFEKAFAYQSKLIDYKDQLLTKQAQDTRSKYEATLNTQEKENEIFRLQKEEEVQRHRNTFLMGGTVLLLLLAGLLFNRNRLKEKSNQLISAEKQRSDELLLNILPASVADELKETGKSKVQYFESVSILFVDLVGFTEISAKNPPEKVVEALDQCFKALDDIAEKYNVEKIKTIGDAYMCASGLPIPNEEHAQNIVKAALEIQTYISKNKERDNPFYLSRIGIHSGPIIAGVVGKRKFAYDIWGDSVNTASRLETNCEPGRVNISRATYELVKDDFKCEARGKIAAKGKGEIEMFYVEKSVEAHSIAI